MRAGRNWCENRTLYSDSILALRACPLLAILLVADTLPAQFSSQVAPLKSDRRRVFEHLDKDGGGRLNIDEFVAGSLGKAADSKRTDFEAWDIDDNGELTFQEFVKQGPDRGERAFDPVREFQYRNLNGDGGLTIDEFLLDREAEPAKWERRFGDIDSNSDGRITLDEYVDAHERWRRQERSAAIRPWIVGALLCIDLFVAVYFLPRFARDCTSRRVEGGRYETS